MSASSWTSLARWKERDWWSADLEGEMETLDVEGGFFWARRRIHGSQREGGPTGPTRIKTGKEKE